jgi:hypothetical protein
VFDDEERFRLVRIEMAEDEYFECDWANYPADPAECMQPTVSPVGWGFLLASFSAHPRPRAFGVAAGVFRHCRRGC